MFIGIEICVVVWGGQMQRVIPFGRSRCGNIVDNKGQRSPAELFVSARL